MNYNDITILILSYEPNETLVRIAKEFKENGFDILIVNDGSSEKFDDIFNRAKEYATVLSYNKNHGKGYAIRYGVNYLSTNRKEQKYFITVDGDGQHLLKDVIKVADKLKETNHITLAVRVFKEDVPFRSKFGNMWSRFTQTLTTDKYIIDNQCGLRGFPLEYSEFLLSIAGNRYEYEMNVISALFMKDYIYEEVKIDAVYEKGNPTSHFSPFIDTCKIQGMILLYGFAFFISIGVHIGLLLLFQWLWTYLGFFNLPEIVEFLISFVYASYCSYLIFSGLNTLVYRPRRIYYHVIRCLYINIGEAIFVIPSILLFTYVLHLPIVLSFFIGLIIALFPMFYFLKWINYLMKKHGN